MEKFERIKIEIDKIYFKGWRREPTQEGVKGLAQSIQLVGLLHPIVVVRMDNGFYQLCAGLCRIYAMHHLGKKEIDACVFEPGGINCELFGIDDYFLGAELSKKEKAELIARRNEILPLIEQQKKNSLESEQ